MISFLLILNLLVFQPAIFGNLVANFEVYAQDDFEVIVVPENDSGGDSGGSNNGGGNGGNSSGGGNRASDGQSFDKQSPESQGAFKEAFGDNAEAEWIRQHNQACAAGKCAAATAAAGNSGSNSGSGASQSQKEKTDAENELIAAQKKLQAAKDASCRTEADCDQNSADIAQAKADLENAQAKFDGVQARLQESTLSPEERQKAARDRGLASINGSTGDNSSEQIDDAVRAANSNGSLDGLRPDQRAAVIGEIVKAQAAKSGMSSQDAAALAAEKAADAEIKRGTGGEAAPAAAIAAQTAGATAEQMAAAAKLGAEKAQLSPELQNQHATAAANTGMVDQRVASTPGLSREDAEKQVVSELYKNRGSQTPEEFGRGTAGLGISEAALRKHLESEQLTAEEIDKIIAGRNGGQAARTAQVATPTKPAPAAPAPPPPAPANQPPATPTNPPRGTEVGHDICREKKVPCGEVGSYCMSNGDGNYSCYRRPKGRRDG